MRLDRLDPELRAALPVVLIVAAGFLTGLALLVYATLTGP